MDRIWYVSMLDPEPDPNKYINWTRPHSTDPSDHLDSMLESFTHFNLFLHKLFHAILQKSNELHTQPKYTRIYHTLLTQLHIIIHHHSNLIKILPHRLFGHFQASSMSSMPSIHDAHHFHASLPFHYTMWPCHYAPHCPIFEWFQLPSNFKPCGGFSKKLFGMIHRAAHFKIPTDAHHIGLFQPKNHAEGSSSIRPPFNFWYLMLLLSVLEESLEEYRWLWKWHNKKIKED